jgi:hypothetical protein
VYVTGQLIWWSDGSVTFEPWFKSVVCEETLIGLEEGRGGGRGPAAAAHAAEAGVPVARRRGC